MSDNFFIRAAGEKDLDALCGLLGELFSVEKDFDVNPSKQKKGLQMMLKDREKCRIFAAEIDGEVIGMVTVQLNISTAEGEYSGLIEDMVITSSCRANGIGRKLLTEAENWCLKQGATRVQLLADKSNDPALGFYKKLSYGTTQMICLRKKFS